MLSKPRRPYRKPTSPCSPGKAAPPSRCGAMEKRKPSTVSPWTVTYAPNGSALAAGGESASKRPSAGGNIRGCRGADLVAQDFDLYGWRCACCGSGDVAVAQHTARSCSAEMPGRAACTAGFGTMACPRDCGPCACPATTPRARADGARSRRSTERSAAVPVTRSSCWRRSSALTGPPVTGTLALQDARRRSQGNEEDR